MRQLTSSGHLAVRSSTSLSGSLAAHGAPYTPSTTPTGKEDRSTALPARALIPFAPSTTRAATSNPLAAPYHLPAAARPGASHAVPLGNTPGAFSPVFTTSSGECVSFSQVDGQWRAAMQAGYGSATLQRTLPVVGPADVGNFLFWLQGQDKWLSRARIHILKMPQAPYGPCVYLGRAGLLGGMPVSPGQGEEQRLCTVPRMAFGAEEWRQYYGEVESAPDLPSDIDEILDSACPFWPDRKVRDTHLIVLANHTVLSLGSDDKPKHSAMVGYHEGGKSKDMLINNIKAQSM
jgi:hypothetical protein